MEQAGIDPAASCMLSKRSTIWATIPSYFFNDEGLKEIYFQPKDNSIIDGLKILKNYAAKLYIERPDPA